MAKNWWGSHPMPGEEAVCFICGPLQLWLRSTADELWISFLYNGGEERSPAGSEQPVPPPEELNWRRWTLKQHYKEIQFLPVFPDLPVVVKPEYPFRVTRDVRTKIYVRVPLWVRILLGKTTIIEIPTVILSKTWFGDFTDGELCYWISSAARKNMEPDTSRPFLSICPIQIINRSEDELLVEKICLRVEQLTLFTFKNQLWANETKTSYRGQAEGSEIEFSPKPPPDAPSAKLVSTPRIVTTKSFTAKTFASLKDLPGFGFLHR